MSPRIIRATIHINRHRFDARGAPKLLSYRARIAAIQSDTPGLIVHKSAARKGQWIVTHARSGKAIGPDFESCKDALEWADALAALGPWDLPGNEVKRRADAAYRLLTDLQKNRTPA